MIVISGALVLVALILLVIGLVSTSLPFVYASIAVSVVSFVFLLIGILQRRGETPAETALEAPTQPQPARDLDGVTAVVPTSGAGAEPPAAQDAEGAPAGGTVLVVAGRPRYHVPGCRYLVGKNPDEVDVTAARDEGFTACGVCKPDAALAEQAAAAPELEPAAQAAPALDPVAAARKTTRARPTTEPGRTPARSARSGAGTTAPARKAAAKKAPSKAAAAAAASTPAAASAAQRPGKVVVIPDRGKFHTANCRYVRNVAGAEERTRAQAVRQGYDACGVCQP